MSDDVTQPQPDLPADTQEQAILEVLADIQEEAASIRRILESMRAHLIDPPPTKVTYRKVVHKKKASPRG